ncbi:unnamed protein product (macronuclear) [Paramecium tetraurelia]|uniref:Cyclin-like domain-containing protein n=1 Tax=Paramecium tetraurelia TaxID=5888 RepID=A0CRD4_PARTE|nr:uncharacterized protein GSPATT00009666001 [Paramecium tetraurelia]CAK73351.1 unnamed protein product [Paramecium tetraurelia]|eukprot:XP_001440748.1 hypothetical protein (macronuclear) [Paramecium tetraurelia strain d4-2]
MKSVNILKMLEANKENRNFQPAQNRQNRVQSTLFIKDEFSQQNIKPRIIRVSKWNKSQNIRDNMKREDHRHISYEMPRQKTDQYQHMQRTLKNRSLTNIQISIINQAQNNNHNNNASISLPNTNKYLVTRGLDKFQSTENNGNPQLVTIYKQDIYNYLEELNQKQQQQNAISYNAFYSQSQINLKMRNVLINWLFEVHHKLKLQLETLLLTIWLLDKFIETNLVQKNRFQLFGIACLFIASKYQEVYGVPKSGQLSKLCDEIYSKEDILKAEGQILQNINFNLSFISPLRIFEHVVEVDDQISWHHLVMDLLMEIPFKQWPLFQTLLEKSLTKRLIPQCQSSQVDSNQTNKLAKELIQTWFLDEVNQPFPSLIKKYQHSHYNHVSTINFSLDLFL